MTADGAQTADAVRDYPTRLYWNNTQLRGGLTDGHQHKSWESSPLPKCPACDRWAEELRHSDGPGCADGA